MVPEDDAVGPAPNPDEVERDRRMEVLLDQTVESPPELPADFSARLLAARPFAPWEVRRAGAWRLPAALFSGLCAASLAVFLAPLWHLGPGTALALWGRLAALAVARPLAALVAFGPAIAAAISRAAGSVPASTSLALLGAAILSAGVLGFAVTRPPARGAAGRAR